jgi:hypothetical protein
MMAVSGFILLGTAFCDCRSALLTFKKNLVGNYHDKSGTELY